MTSACSCMCSVPSWVNTSCSREASPRRLSPLLCVVAPGKRGRSSVRTGEERTGLEGWGRGGRLPYFETCVSEWARTESGALEMHASTVACIRCTSLGLTQRSIKMGVRRRVCLHMRLACACAQVRKREEGPAYTSLLCGTSLQASTYSLGNVGSRSR